MDSRAQIPVISQRLYEQCNTEFIGKIGLQPVVGHVVDVPLVNVSLRLCNESDAYVIKSDLPLVCAVADINATDYGVILPSDVHRELHDLPVVEVRKPVLFVNDAAVDDDYSILSSDVDSVDKPTNNVADCGVDTFIQEQKIDPTLANCWTFAHVGKGGFVVCRGLLYHEDKVDGQKICQLCVPKERRAQVLKLAHASIFGGHMGERKTRERIRLSFLLAKITTGCKGLCCVM